MGLSCSLCGRGLCRLKVAHVCVVFKICYEISCMFYKSCIIKKHCVLLSHFVDMM